MRGIDTPVRKMRREIFKEIAQLAYHSDNLNDDVEALPYKIVNPETPIYRESIYREREIVREVRQYGNWNSGSVFWYRD